MAKTITPLLSFEAHGTLADSITFQKGRDSKIVRKKPRLPYFLTLPARYQRWLYQDYAYLWTQQSIATKQTYQSDGAKCHLTGFQYWMKYQLTNMPDIAGYWKLDEPTGAVAYDSSRNENHGVIIGASPATGVINGCRSFDGINDKVNIPHHTSLNMGILDFSVDFFIKTTAVGSALFNKRNPVAPVQGFYSNVAAGGEVGIWIRATADKGTHTIVLNDGFWHHIAANFDRDANLSLFTDAIPGDTADISSEAGSIDNANPFYLVANRHGGGGAKAVIDHFCLRTRLLSLPEIQRFALRRWP